MKEIVDHRSNATAISKDDGFVISSGGNRTAKKPHADGNSVLNGRTERPIG